MLPKTSPVKSAHIIPAREGAFTILPAGDLLKITNTHGTQVVDMWAFGPLSTSSTRVDEDDTFAFKYSSMSNTRATNLRLALQAGDNILDNHRQPMLSLLEDTSGGTHDMLFPACDRHRYIELGVVGHHRSCADNLRERLQRCSEELSQSRDRDLMLAIPKVHKAVGSWTPDPLNLFMNVPIKGLNCGQGGELSLENPRCPKGGSVLFKAVTGCVVVMSACPMDLNAVNGFENKGAGFEVWTGG